MTVPPATPTVNPCGAVSTWDEQRRGTRVAQRLARQIIDDVYDNGLAPGDMLGAEAQLIERYEVGRATLREALQLLELQGAVVAKRGPKGGIFVGEATAQDFARMARLHLQARRATYGEVQFARRAIEPLMARIAAETLDADGLAELDAVIADSERLDVTDDGAFFRNLSQFHVTVSRMSGNAVLDTVATIVQEVHDARWSIAVPAERKVSALEVHRAIAEAIRAGDGVTAERLMREHVEESEGAYPRVAGDEHVRWR